MTEPNEPQPQPASPPTTRTFRTEFATHLLNLDEGAVHDDATARLAELIEAIELTAKGGKLVLVIEIEPLDPETFTETGSLVVSGQVEVKKPRLTRAATVFTLTDARGEIEPVKTRRTGDRAK